MDTAPGKGTMGTVFAEASQVEAILQGYEDLVSLASCNARESCVISGDAETVDMILEKAAQEEIKVNKLKVSHGFHSKLMEPIMVDFKNIADSVTYKKSKIRFVSSLYAREISDSEILDSQYWTDHIREKVDFYHAVMSISDHLDYAFLEVGPNRVLSTLYTMIFEGNGIVAGSLNLKKPDAQQLPESIALLYTAGVNLDWKKIECKGQKSWKKVALPNYHFDRIRHWKEPLYDCGSIDLSTSKSHPLLGQKFESPCMNNTVVFQSHFNSEKPYFMPEHIIFDTPISPAAAHISMIISSIKELTDPTSCIIKDLELLTPLAIQDEGGRTVQICFEKGSYFGFNFNIVSRNAGDDGGDWIVHAKGKAASEAELVKSDRGVNLEDISELSFGLDIEQGVYAQMYDTGFRLGESFRRIKKASCENGQGVCYIEPLYAVPDLKNYEMYPGIIDSILQTMLCVVIEEYNKNETEKTKRKTIIPYSIGKIAYNYVKSDKLWCLVKAKEEKEVAYGSIDVFNEKGETVMLIHDVLVKYTDQQTLLAGISKDLSKLYYQIDWVESDRNIRKTKSEKIKYLIIAEDQNEAQLLSQHLSSKGDEVHVVINGSEGIDTIDLHNKESIARLLEEIRAQNDQREIRFIYLPQNFSNMGQDWLPDTEFGMMKLKGLLYLVQSLEKAELIEKSSITLVTKGGQRINKVDVNTHDPILALLWGFARTIRTEYPRFKVGTIDIERMDFNDQAEEIAIEIESSEGEEVCLRDGRKRYVSMLVRHSDYLKKGHTNLQRIEIKDNGAYLITGGTGAVGMSYANVLVEKGAKQLILLCRHEPSKETKEKCEEWNKTGVQIEIIYTNVAEEKQLRDTLLKVDEKFPMIKGVIHAAGIIIDRMISDLTWDECEQVLRPKVLGTCNLYNILDNEALDFFLMVSSISSILGNAGQSNYVAANCFMNSLADYIQTMGKTSLAYCWGPWGTGMALDETVVKNMDRLGIRPFALDMTGEMISGFFEKPFTNIIAADIDWEKYVENSDNEERAFYSKISKKNHVREEQKDIDVAYTILHELKDMTHDNRKDALIFELQNICKNILGFGQGQQPQADKTFKELGADSLMIFSIRNSINKLLKTDLNVSAFFNYPTLAKLAEYLNDDILFPLENEIDEHDLELEIEQMISALDEKL